MTITSELSADQERLLREGAASADASAMRDVLIQAIDSTIERMLRLASKSTPDHSKEAVRETAHGEWSTRSTLKELLLAASPRAEIPIPSRQRWRRRAPEAFE